MNPSSVRELSEGVRSGAIRGDGLVNAAILNIQQQNGTLNALVSERTGDARREAETIRPGLTAGELAGVPFTAKDVLSTVDLPTTCGSRALSGWKANVDATAVAKMRGAGAVLVGKSNCPEFALGVDTNNDLFGRTLNPLGNWTPGGSSGGEASAISAGMSLVGLGTDYGGSLRWPAQCAALVGLRPTVGRVSRSGEHPTLPSTSPLRTTADSFQDRVAVIGPLARTVDDVALVLRIISGPDGHDSLAVDRPLGEYRDLDLENVEVRWGVEVGNVGVHPEVARAVNAAVSTLKSGGARTVQGLPREVHEAVGVYDRLRAGDQMRAISVLRDRDPSLISSAIKDILDARVQTPPQQWHALLRQRERLIESLAQWLAGERVLVLPVSVDIPRDLGGRVGNFDLLTPSRAISLFGLPALSVPVWRTHGGRPVSVQVVAPEFREDLALSVGSALERANSIGIAREASGEPLL